MKTVIKISAALFCMFFLSHQAIAQLSAPPNVFYDKQAGTFKQNKGSLTLVVKRHQTNDRYGNSKQGILVTSSNSSTPVFYVRISGNQPNRYVMEANKSFSIVYTSNNSLEFRIPGANVQFNRVTLTYSENFYVDGDNKIELRIYEHSNGAIPSNQVRFTFATKKDVTWWKGIKVIDKNRRSLGILELQDNNHGPSSKDFNMNSFGGNYVVTEIWKAKAFGVHTFMEKHYIRLNDCKGKEVSLFWVNDH